MSGRECLANAHNLFVRFGGQLLIVHRRNSRVHECFDQVEVSYVLKPVT